MKVLVLDSESSRGQSYVQDLLQNPALEVCLTETGEEALEAHRRFSFDVAVIDLELTGPLNGIETAERLMKIRNLELIFCAHTYEANLSQAALLLQPALMLVKPVDSHRLCVSLQQIRRRLNATSCNNRQASAGR